MLIVSEQGRGLERQHDTCHHHFYHNYLYELVIWCVTFRNAKTSTEINANQVVKLIGSFAKLSTAKMTEQSKCSTIEYRVFAVIMNARLCRVEPAKFDNREGQLDWGPPGDAMLCPYDGTFKSVNPLCGMAVVPRLHVVYFIR